MRFRIDYGKAKSIEQTDSKTYEELIRIATDLEDNNFNEEFITSVGDYQLQLIILGALDKAGLQVEAAQLLMMFGDLTTLGSMIQKTMELN